jgi:hypothetical protein
MANTATANTVVKEGLETKENDTGAGATLHPGSGSGGGSEPRSTILASIIAAAGGIELGDLTKFRDSLVMNTGANQSKSTDNSEKNKATIVPKGVAASALKEDLVAMFKDQNLSEETLTSLVTIFEAQVNARTLIEANRLEEEYEAKLTEEVTELRNEMVETVDKYTNYAVNEWMNDNKVSIDESLELEITKDFMKGLKKLFKEHYIKVPKDGTDVLQELANENKSLTDKLTEAINKNIELEKSINEGKKATVVEQLTAGLSEAQKVKFRTLSESVEYNADENVLKTNLTAIKENLTKLPASKANTGIITEESASKTEAEIAAEDKAEVKLDPEMQSFVDAISDSVQKQ